MKKNFSYRQMKNVLKSFPPSRRELGKILNDVEKWRMIVMSNLEIVKNKINDFIEEGFKPKKILFNFTSHP